MPLPTRPGACLTQTCQERLAILMVAKDLPALVAARHDVINRPRALDANGLATLLPAYPFPPDPVKPNVVTFIGLARGCPGGQPALRQRHAAARGDAPALFHLVVALPAGNRGAGGTESRAGDSMGAPRSRVARRSPSAAPDAVIASTSF